MSAPELVSVEAKPEFDRLDLLKKESAELKAEFGGREPKDSVGKAKVLDFIAKVKSLANDFDGRKEEVKKPSYTYYKDILELFKPPAKDCEDIKTAWQEGLTAYGRKEAEHLAEEKRKADEELAKQQPVAEPNKTEEEDDDWGTDPMPKTSNVVDLKPTDGASTFKESPKSPTIVPAGMKEVVSITSVDFDRVRQNLNSLAPVLKDTDLQKLIDKMVRKEGEATDIPGVIVEKQLVAR